MVGVAPSPPGALQAGGGGGSRKGTPAAFGGEGGRRGCGQRTRALVCVCNVLLAAAQRQECGGGGMGGGRRPAPLGTGRPGSALGGNALFAQAVPVTGNGLGKVPRAAPPRTAVTVGLRPRPLLTWPDSGGPPPGGPPRVSAHGSGGCALPGVALPFDHWGHWGHCSPPPAWPACPPDEELPTWGLGPWLLLCPQPERRAGCP